MAQLQNLELSSNPPVDMPQMLAAAKKVLGISHMELLSESSCAQPRLGRLLGHKNAYDNAHRWYSGNEGNIARAEEEAKRVQVQTAAKINHQHPQKTKQLTSVLMLRTLADFQATISGNIEAAKQIVAAAAIVISNEKLEKDEAVNSDEILEYDSDEDSDWSDGEDPIIEFIKNGTRLLLMHDAELDGGHDIITSEMPPASKDQWSSL